MTSEKQAIANRRNGARSRGPSTPEGKQIAAANAIGHGFRAATELLIPGDDPNEFAAFAAAMRADLHSLGAVEDLLTERLISLSWRLRRVPRVEAELLRWHCLEETLERARADVASYEDIEQDEDFEEHEVITQPRRHARAVQVLIELTRARDAETVFGRAFRRASGSSDQLGLIERYERALQRSWLQCLHELQRLQAMRHGEAVPLPVAVDVQVDSAGANGFVR